MKHVGAFFTVTVLSVRTVIFGLDWFIQIQALTAPIRVRRSLLSLQFPLKLFIHVYSVYPFKRYGICLFISILRVASGPRVKLASCKSALTPPVVYSTDRSKALVPVLVSLFVALWFILRGDLFYVILFLCFSVLLALRLPRLGKRELILVLFVRLFDLCLFGFVGFLFLLVSGKGCGL